MSLKKSLALLGTLILLAVILVACGGKPEPSCETHHRSALPG
jgi:hypothetical protein